MDAKTLSGILGHTNASFTLDTYTHMTTDMQKNASNIVGSYMDEIMLEGDDTNSKKTKKRRRGRLRAPPVADTASKKEWRNKEYCDALQASKTTMLQQEGDVC